MHPIGVIKLRLELFCGGVGVNYLTNSRKSVSGEEQAVLYTKYER